jgi:chromosome segregation ATPase
MESASTRLSTETHRLVRETADERDDSLAEVLRDLVEKGLEYDDLQRELEQTEARVEDLRQQLQEANAGKRDVDELVAYVEEERELQRQREKREQRREERRNAPAWRRAKWWVFGRSDDGTEA